MGVAATAGFTAACGRRKATGYPGFALVATAGTSSVAAVDLMSFRVTKTIPLRAAPAGIVAVDDRSYILTPENGSVHIIDSRLELIASARVSDGVLSVKLTSDGERLLALTLRELIVIDSTSLRVLQRLRLRARPFDWDVWRSDRVAISFMTEGTVELIDLGTGPRRHVRMPGETGAVRFRADGQVLLVANWHDRSLTAIDVATLQTIADLPLAMRPENLCFWGTGQLFISGAGMDGIAIVYPYHTLQVDQTLLAGHEPGVMASSEAPAYLFTASRAGSSVCIVSIDNRKAIGYVEVGEEPRFITVTPDNQYALILNRLSGDMAVIRIPSIRANRFKTGAALFDMVPVGEEPVAAAIVRT
jgi:YVTN family beta-propeller protein